MEVRVCGENQRNCLPHESVFTPSLSQYRTESFYQKRRAQERWRLNGEDLNKVTETIFGVDLNMCNRYKSAKRHMLNTHQFYKSHLKNN